LILGQATGGRPPLKNNLLAPLRLFRRVADRGDSASTDDLDDNSL
jgi:hypothetical protein